MISEILLGLLALLGIGGTVWGYAKGKSAANADRAQENVKAGQASKDNRNELESQDDKHLVDILSGRVRDR